MSNFLELFDDTIEKLDSLDAAQASNAKLDSLKAVADAAAQAKIDSTVAAQAAIPTTTSEKAGTVPAMKVWNKYSEIVNQGAFDLLAQTYNAAGVPLNSLGRFFGYNPGFSGERFVKKWFGDYVGAEPRFDYEDSAWGTYAPEGGEFSWERPVTPPKKGI